MSAQEIQKVDILSIDGLFHWVVLDGSEIVKQSCAGSKTLLEECQLLKISLGEILMNHPGLRIDNIVLLIKKLEAN